MKTKPITPYARLKETFKKFAADVVFPHTHTMFVLPKKNLNLAGYTLLDVWERTAAAKQLGYEVVLHADEDALRINYRTARPTEMPWDVR